ncbi:unnamed protein product [Schistosoma curassoni]|uniref:SNF2_N domain-containing protein n=1 Tax=Schistosoma curassoni TaxID=6186 RepID=A0A183L4E8_9TREM|nr:unnamed protein product [Schistosoma curassoni]
MINCTIFLKELGNNWERFEQNSHVVVHLPSASYSESIRQQLGSIEELEYMESRQIARICEIRNPNRDVVIVTRAPISDDLLEYYNKLLGLTTAIETGQAENQCSISSRYRIIVPEAIKYFHFTNDHNYCKCRVNIFSLENDSKTQTPNCHGNRK